MEKASYIPPVLNPQEHEKSMGYRLCLANGQEWNLLAAEEVNPWLQQLAEVMQLSPQRLNGSPKVIFTLKNEAGPLEALDPSLQEVLPAEGWELHDLKAVYLWSHALCADVICELRNEESHEFNIIRMWQALTPIYQKVLAGGGFPFHCGFVSRDGQGVLLAAPGNTGKSTCCRRIPPPWKALSDDEALIVLSSNRREYLVHPMPTWSNFMWKREGFATSWKAEAAVPLRAIFFLEQSETEAVEPLGQGQAAVFIHESALQVCRRGWRNLEADRERAFKKKVFENACDLSQRIPSFLLKVSLTGRFWKKMDQALFNGLAL